MPLEKYEDFLELSVKQYTIKSNFPWSDVWCLKNQTLILLVEKSGIFCTKLELCKSKFNSVPFKR